MTIRRSNLKQLLCAVILSSASSTTLAATTTTDLSRLGLSGTELTPAGAIRAGNAEGTIPPWKNEPIIPPKQFKAGTFHPDPFASDSVQFKITSRNYQQYADKLSEGQKKMFKTYPDFYMNIYPSRRTAVYKPYIYESALKNAKTAEIVVTDKGMIGFKNAHKAWAFPIPKNGNEAWMNQASRPINPWMESWETTLAITSTGKYVINKLNIQQHYKWSDPEVANFDPSEVSFLYYQTLISPAKFAGQVVLAKDPVVFTEKFRAAWAYSPGQRRVKRAPQIVYDNPLTASDGLATTDQKWGFNGPNDRFNWKLIGKQEMYVPYNAYKHHSPDATPDKIITAEGRVNQEYSRYELHRVWIIESTLREGTNHDYGKRTFYLDEDSWWIMLVDGYDRRNQIWRLWESHDVFYYDTGFLHSAAEFQYDMQAGRMIALGFDKENPPDFTWRANDNYFTPASVRQNGVR